MRNWFALILIASQLAIAPVQAEVAIVKKAGTSTKLAGQTSAKTVAANRSSNDAKMDAFIDGLMAKMTIDEKIGQLNLLSIGSDVTGPIVSQGVDEKIAKGQVGGVFNLVGPSAVRKLQEMVMQKSRLKIPMFFGYDVIHGHHTIFPIPLGLSSSWNLDLIEKTASAAAREASADGLNWTFSPMVDITRDPRWGRVMEGSGEDPYLGSAIAKAMVRGYQGSDYGKADKVMACVKHFALYGGAEAGRDYNTVDMSRQRMFNDYFPPYKAAVEAKVASVMTSFNEIDGVPASANYWLMTDLLRKQWGFDGFIATDYTAINEMIAHGMGDEKKVAELSLNAGVDMDMVSEAFTKYGAKLVAEGKVSQHQIDAACRRVLEAKYKLGLFQDPYRYINEERNKQEMMSVDKLTLSQEAATKSIVLLKNANNVLPLDVHKNIAFIGPLLKDQRSLMGAWNASGHKEDVTTLAKALEEKLGQPLGGAAFTYSKGCNLVDDPDLIEKLNRDGGELTLDEKSPQALIEEAVAAAKQADVVVAVLGETFAFSSEAASRSNIGLLDNQTALLKALKQTGKPIVLVLMNGRPLTLEWEDKNIDGILETWYGGTKAAAAIVSVLFGDTNPSGKLTMTFPRNVGQIPIYYASKNTGRPFVAKEKYHSQYLDVPNTPLYPFGHGLSYTTFKYSDLTVSDSQMKGGGQIAVTAKVTNTGNREGIETAQLYIRDMVGTITRPVKELKGFKQISLQPGESKTVAFMLDEKDLRFYNANLKYAAEPGEFKVMIGGNSQELLEGKFDLASK